MEKINLLTLVIPAYKQETTIVKNIESLKKTLALLQCRYELIVVVDGFNDKTYEYAKELAGPTIKVFGYPTNRGKGFAVKYGVLHSKGDVVGFIDAGMDIDPAGVAMLLNHMLWYDADIIIGSKLHPVSQVHYPVVRRVLSWGYRFFIRIIFGLDIKDTQVGLKFYKRKVAMDVFPRLLVKQFAFDIETLAVANDLGYSRIFEGPVKLDFQNRSTISLKNLTWIIMQMLWDTAAVFYRLRIKRYYHKVNIRDTPASMEKSFV